MGSLLNSLGVVAESMRAMQRSIEVTSNNVTNANTPGFAKQSLALVSKRFELHSGMSGGVDQGPLVSSRRAYLETSVQDQAQKQGRAGQRIQSMELMEPIFNITEGSGVAAAIDKLFQGFSQWSVNPNDIPLRQSVLQRASDMSFAFQNTASAMNNAKANTDSELSATVRSINELGGIIRDFNAEIRTDRRKLSDAGLDAQIHARLEALAEFVDYDLLRGEDGSYTVLIGGQTPLTIGGSLFPIELDLSNGPAVIRDSQGADITSQFSGGKLKGLLEVRNDFHPSLMADLNLLAETVASRINDVLRVGVDRNGNTPTQDLFRTDPVAGSAATLSVNPLLPEELAGASLGAPGGNGNILNLAALATSKEVNDFTFSQFYGFVAGRVGHALSSARDDERAQELLLSQARQLRAEASQVSLDEEAANLIAFQRAYQANAQLVTVLDGLTETVINMIR